MIWKNQFQPDVFLIVFIKSSTKYYWAHFWIAPNFKNDNDPTLSCRIYWCLSTSWGQFKAPTETPRTLRHYGIEEFERDLQIGSHYSERAKVFLVWRNIISCKKSAEKQAKVSVSLAEK